MSIEHSQNMHVFCNVSSHSFSGRSGPGPLGPVRKILVVRSGPEGPQFSRSVGTLILTKSCYFFISFKSLKIIKLRHSTLFFILFHHNFLSIINGHWQTFDFVECSKCMFKSNFYIYSVKKSWCCHYNFTFSDDHCVVEDFHWIACWPWSSRIRWCPAVRVRSSVVQH